MGIKVTKLLESVLTQYSEKHRKVTFNFTRIVTSVI